MARDQPTCNQNRLVSDGEKNLMNDSSQLKVLIEILIEAICIYDRN